MKKNLVIYSLGLGIMIFSSCLKEPNEIHPDINFDDFTSTDTTYILSSPPAAQDKHVLIEESTGDRCTNCPYATELIHQMDQDNGDKIDVISIHYGGGPLNEPHHEKPDLDLRPDGTIGNSYINLLGGVQAQPAAAVDRTIPNGSTVRMNNRTFWPSQVNQQFTKNTPVNLELKMTDDPTASRILVDFKISYNSTPDTTTADYYSIVLLESGIIGAQDSAFSVVLNPYTFNEVFRTFIGPVSGEKIVASRVAGRVIEKGLAIPYENLNSAWVKSNLSMVLFVHKNDPSSLEVLNSRTAHIQ